MDTLGYANTGQAANTQLVSLPLDRIATSADRVERLGNMVKYFADRFYNGGEPAAPDVGNTVRAVPVGHNGQIDRLSDAIDFLDSAVQTLSSIG